MKFAKEETFDAVLTETPAKSQLLIRLSKEMARGIQLIYPSS